MNSIRTMFCICLLATSVGCGSAPGGEGEQAPDAVNDDIPASQSAPQKTDSAPTDPSPSVIWTCDKDGTYCCHVLRCCIWAPPTGWVCMG